MKYIKENGVDANIRACPVCGAVPEIFRRFNDDRSNVSVVCSVSESISNNLDFGIQSGCLLYMPPEYFWKATIIEAVTFWNSYAAGLTEFRKKRESGAELQKLFDLIEQAAHNTDSALHAKTPDAWIESIWTQKRKAEAEQKRRAA